MNALRVLCVIAPILLSIGDVWANESTCTAVDLRNDALGPVRDQGGIGSCYAFTAADLLGYELGQRVSAVGVMIAYQERHRANRIRLHMSSNVSYSHLADLQGSGERLFVVLRQALKVPNLCLERELPSGGYMNGNLREVLDLVDNLRTKYRTGREVNCTQDELRIVQDMFPLVTHEDMAERLGGPWWAAATGDPNYFPGLRDATCETVVRAPENWRARNLRNVSDERYLTEIDRILNAGSPIGLSYDPRILVPDGMNLPRTYQHASLIVGRRWNSSAGQCEYLIRNSFGPGCEKTFDPNRCESGNIWMPVERLRGAMNEISYIQKN